MRRERMIEIGKLSREKIVGAECANDESTASSAELLATLLRARLSLNLAVTIEEEMLAEIGETIAAGLKTRQRLIRLHGRLAEIATKAGIIKSVGDGGDKDGTYIIAPVGLTVVENGAQAA